jgi:hypothetical protein
MISESILHLPALGVSLRYHLKRDFLFRGCVRSPAQRSARASTLRISYPLPLGGFWSCRGGRKCSADAACMLRIANDSVDDFRQERRVNGDLLSGEQLRHRRCDIVRTCAIFCGPVPAPAAANVHGPMHGLVSCMQELARMHARAVY